MFATYVNLLLVATPHGPASFALGTKRYPATLVNLPTVVETYKTFDNSSYVKTGDIGQVRSNISMDDHLVSNLDF
jgi:TATA-binding protein-associated factor Taf7